MYIFYQMTTRDSSKDSSQMERLCITINIRLNGYKLRPMDEIKYLGIYLDKYLNGHCQSKLVMQKLARALYMLSKVRYYVAKNELKNIYHAIFESHLR